MAPSRRDTSEARAQRRETPAERRTRRAAVDDVDDVLDAAARFLETRSRSMAEVRRRLVSAGYREVLVEGAIARLTEQGYLDDEAFARAWVESRDRARPRGERAIRLELAQKGIDRATVDAVLAERSAPASDAANGDATIAVREPLHARESVEEDAARRLVERQRRSLLREPDPAKRRQKAYALLARNGFDPDVCRVVAAAFLSASSLADGSDARSDDLGPP